MTKGSTLKSLRLLHRYLGLFFAPAILFFSFSGAIQTFNWHEASRSTGYEPPAWILRMAQLHKKQTLALPAPKKSQKMDARDPTTPPAKKNAGDVPGKFIFKCFVFAMSIGLVASTLLGITMALLYSGDRRIVWCSVLAGIVFPTAILWLGR